MVNNKQADEAELKEPLLQDDNAVTRKERSNSEKVKQSLSYRIACKIWGDIPHEDFHRIIWFAFILFFLISGYWLLRSLKDSIVIAINGRQAIPKMKITSLFVVFGLVAIYNKLIDMLPKHKLFYVICTFYFFIFATIGYLLTHETIGLPNKDVSESRIIGWVSYCSIESFGSISIALFWSYVNSSMSLKGAKSSFGLIIAISQIGAVMGPTIVSQAKHIGVPLCYTIGACHMLAVNFMVFMYVQEYGVHKEDAAKAAGGDAKKGPAKKKPGMMEGLYIFAKYGYIRGIFVISCVYYVQETVLDFTLKSLADEKFKAMYPDDPAMATGELASFLGTFGQRANGITFIASLLGTSYVIQKFGIRISVLLFPTFTVLGMVWVYMQRELWVVYTVVILMKAGCYCLNNPVKEILYQPTTTACKFKAKSWIDVFGSRGMKAAGASISTAYGSSIPVLISTGGLIAGGVSCFLWLVAFWLGFQFDALIKEGKKVGEELEETLPTKTEKK